MKVVNTLLAGIMITAGAASAIVTMSATPVQATLAQTGVCPSDLGHAPEGGGGAGSATDCNGLITFGANNAISTSFGPQTKHDSIEEAHPVVPGSSTYRGGGPNLKRGWVSSFRAP
jgi:hypothetical protein